MDESTQGVDRFESECLPAVSVGPDITQNVRFCSSAVSLNQFFALDRPPFAFPWDSFRPFQWNFGHNAVSCFEASYSIESSLLLKIACEVQAFLQRLDQVMK